MSNPDTLPSASDGPTQQARSDKVPALPVVRRPRSLDEMLALLAQSRRTQAAAEDCTLLPGDYDLLRAYAADDLPAEEAEVVEDFLAASPNWRHGLSEVIVQRVEQDRKQLSQLLGFEEAEREG